MHSFFTLTLVKKATIEGNANNFINDDAVE
jgi:hypothetical protein